MYYDPTGHSLLVALLILTAIFVTAGGIYGGVSAAMTGNNIWEGIGKGMLVGGVFSAALALTIGGFTYGWTTVLGSIMITYGASVMANMVEVSGTQWHKSTYDGDNSWNKANDIINASFANLGRVLVGSSFVPDILILGTKITSKIPLVSKFFDNVNVLKQSYSTSTAYSMTWNNFWSSKVSRGSVIISVLTTSYQIYKAFNSIFGQPDIENSRWILY